MILRLMRAVIGMNKEEFSKLLDKFSLLANRLKYKRNLKRKHSAGRKYTLKNTVQKLFLYEMLSDL